MPGNISYGKSLFIAIDQLLNAIFLGWPDETLSSRAWRMHLDGISLPKNIIDTILFFDKNHCEESCKSEQLRKQLPPELRSL